MIRIFTSLLLSFILSFPALAELPVGEMDGLHYLPLRTAADIPEPERSQQVAEEQESEKKCMTICKEWGEKCIVNPRTGKRDCRRICKRFGEECF